MANHADNAAVHADNASQAVAHNLDQADKVQNIEEEEILKWRGKENLEKLRKKN